jgi:hypothetical protein
MSQSLSKSQNNTAVRGLTPQQIAAISNPTLRMIVARLVKGTHFRRCTYTRRGGHAKSG